MGAVQETIIIISFIFFFYTYLNPEWGAIAQCTTTPYKSHQPLTSKKNIHQRLPLTSLPLGTNLLKIGIALIRHSQLTGR